MRTALVIKRKDGRVEELTGKGWVPIEFQMLVEGIAIAIFDETTGTWRLL